MDERLTKNPDQLTVLGLDKGKYAWARSRLTEASLKWVRESKQDTASRLKRLRAFGRSTLSGADLVNYDTVEFQMETIARTEPFEYGDGVRPYVVSQLTGAYQSIPTFLDRQHRIENREDAEAYLARLRAFAVVLDQETERVRHDAGLKVAPPDFLIERTLEQMRTLHSTEPADSILTTSIAKRTQKLGLQGSYGTNAARIVTAEVYPALERQMQALAELRPGAAHEAGVGRPAPGGYYQIPALDGSRPGAFYINLRDSSEWSRWKLPTLVYHESEPGHHFQLALVLEMPSLPLIRKAGGGFSANTEGWALYAEQLCDEMGLYESDPLGRLGLLQSLLFRAARCVVDTGLHAKGWSRERAIDYMVSTTGENGTAMTTEVERYCTWPGQACSYKVGHTRWLKLRPEAQRRLGAKFDIRDFHDVGLSAAPTPLSALA